MIASSINGKRRKGTLNRIEKETIKRKRRRLRRRFYHYHLVRLCGWE